MQISRGTHKYHPKILQFTPVFGSNYDILFPRSRYIVALQANGKAFYSLNEWGKMSAGNGLDKAIRQWCVGTYLMGKAQASGVYISTTQGYGNLNPGASEWPELYAKVGHALGPMAKQQASTSNVEIVISGPF